MVRRDKIALSKAKGMWMGGVTALGYDKGDRVLAPNAAETDVIRSIFARYLKLGSLHTLCEELRVQGVRSKRWVTTKGSVFGGAEFSRGALFHLLQNRHYLGEMVHKDQTHPGLHPAIVDAKLFEAVQRRLEKNRVTRCKGSLKVAGALLTWRIYDQDGARFSPTFSTGRTGRIHRYYVLTDIQLGREGERRDGAIRRVGADALEGFALAELRRLADRLGLGAASVPDVLLRIELRSSDTHLVLDRDAIFGDDHPELALEEQRERLREGERLVVEPDGRSLRIALPRRMPVRGRRTWTLGQTGVTTGPVADAVLGDGLRRAHALAACGTPPCTPLRAGAKAARLPLARRPAPDPGRPSAHSAHSAGAA